MKTFTSSLPFPITQISGNLEYHAPFSFTLILQMWRQFQKGEVTCQRLNFNQYNKLCERSNYWFRLAEIIHIREGLWECWQNCFQLFFLQVIIHFKKKYVSAPFFISLEGKQEILMLKKTHKKSIFCMLGTELVLRIQLWTRQTRSHYSQMQLWKISKLVGN